MNTSIRIFAAGLAAMSFIATVTLSANAQGFNPNEMVTVPAGQFISGCEESDPWFCPSDAQPKKQIYLDGFKIDKYPVTFKEYEKCVADGDCTEPFYGAGCNAGMRWNDRHPVNCVDWEQAKKFCQVRGKRLPTEAEWEKAARGTDGRTFPWGEQAPNCNRAVMNKKTAPDVMGPGCGRGTTREVGRKPAGVSPYGAHDMAGNVYEWTADWYGEDYYKTRPTRNPKGPRNGIWRSGRSSSWLMRTPEGMSLNIRFPYSPLGQGYVVGFRCAKNL